MEWRPYKESDDIKLSCFVKTRNGGVYFVGETNIIGGVCDDCIEWRHPAGFEMATDVVAVTGPIVNVDVLRAEVS